MNNVFDENSFLGEIESGYLAYSTNDEVRYQASSGGFCKSFLNFLLETNEVDKVIITRLKKDEPLTAETIITDAVEDILSPRTNSIYGTVHPFSVLRELECGVRYVFVGLPCHVRAFYKYAEKNNINIFLISLLCNHIPYEDGVSNSILSSMYINKHEVTYFEYRGHGWPGFVYIKTIIGEEFKLSFSSCWSRYMSRTPQLPVKCKKCLDISGIYSNISVGDPWNIVDRSDTIGKSLIIVRDKKSEMLVKNAEEKKFILLQPVSKEAILLSQRTLYNLKKERNYANNIK